jgi:predicted site-specific integrase-resolvase
MNKFLSIQKAAEILGVTPQTLRRWERSNKIEPSHRTTGGQRRYDITKLQPVRAAQKHNLLTIAYARVSSHDQKDDLQHQAHMLEMYCAAEGWNYEIIKDLGSGMNYHKRGLKSLLERIAHGQFGRLVLTHKDRLLRFGAELIFSLCAIKKIEVVIINQGDEPSFEEELAKDVLEIITVFSARLYSSRSHKNKKLMDNLRRATHASL